MHVTALSVNINFLPICTEKTTPSRKIVTDNYKAVSPSPKDDYILISPKEVLHSKSTQHRGRAECSEKLRDIL